MQKPSLHPSNQQYLQQSQAPIANQDFSSPTTPSPTMHHIAYPHFAYASDIGPPSVVLAQQQWVPCIQPVQPDLSSEIVVAQQTIDQLISSRPLFTATPNPQPQLQQTWGLYAPHQAPFIAQQPPHSFFFL